MKSSAYPYTIGDQWFIQTVTLYFVGTIIDVTNKEIILENAAWIPDTGRFHEFIGGKQPKEMEPCLDAIVVISRGAIVTAMPHAKIVIE